MAGYEDIYREMIRANGEIQRAAGELSQIAQRFEDMQREQAELQRQCAKHAAWLNRIIGALIFLSAGGTALAGWVAVVARCVAGLRHTTGG